jgi:hypothetical protein
MDDNLIKETVIKEGNPFFSADKRDQAFTHNPENIAKPL